MDRDLVETGRDDFSPRTFIELLLPINCIGQNDLGVPPGDLPKLVRASSLKSEMVAKHTLK